MKCNKLWYEYSVGMDRSLNSDITCRVSHEQYEYFETVMIDGYSTNSVEYFRFHNNDSWYPTIL